MMKTLRSLWLEPVLKDLQDRDNNDFMMLESRLRSAYIKLDSDFRKEAPGPKSLCSNLAYMYDLVGLVEKYIIAKTSRRCKGSAVRVKGNKPKGTENLIKKKEN